MKGSPCKDCPERFRACSDRCPIDLRGGYGYKAWLADAHKEKAMLTAMRIQKSEDSYRDRKYGFEARKRRHK